MVFLWPVGLFSLCLTVFACSYASGVEGLFFMELGTPPCQQIIYKGNVLHRTTKGPFYGCFGCAICVLFCGNFTSILHQFYVKRHFLCHFAVILMPFRWCLNVVYIDQSRTNLASLCLYLFLAWSLIRKMLGAKSCPLFVCFVTALLSLFQCLGYSLYIKKMVSFAVCVLKLSKKSFSFLLSLEAFFWCQIGAKLVPNLG